MRESWVPPVTEGREAPPEWVAVWRFRVVCLLVTLILVAVVFVGYQWLTGAYDGVSTNPDRQNIPRAIGSAFRFLTG